MIKRMIKGLRQRIRCKASSDRLDHPIPMQREPGALGLGSLC
jgi:hypothetical protein